MKELSRGVGHSARDLDPIACAVFLICAFVLAGFMQTIWFRSRVSASLQIPVDGLRTIRGKRIFGDNKTWRGFAIMVPACGSSFFLLHSCYAFWNSGWTEQLWRISSGGYFLLGCWMGFGFMAGELPNSFLKRQLSIAPGAAPAHQWGKPACFLLDRLDSITGSLLALALVVPIPLLTWAGLLIVGPAIHWGFSLLLFQIGVKARPA